MELQTSVHRDTIRYLESVGLDKLWLTECAIFNRVSKADRQDLTNKP